MSEPYERDLDDLGEEAIEQAERATGLTRREILRRSGVTVAGLGLASITAGPALGAGTAASPLNKLFGAGGKKAGSDVTLRAGMMLAVTGQGSFYGRVMSRGAQLAAKQIKAAGGFDYQISIGDHQSGLVPPAISELRRLATQKKIQVLQTSYGAPSEAMVPLIKQYKLLSFNGGGSSPGQLGKDYLWQTRMLYGIDPMYGSLTYLAKRYKAKKLAIVGTLENAVEAEKTEAPKAWPKISGGGKIVTTEIHEVGITDFGNVIARVKSANPDVIWTASFGNDLGYMVKQMREQGVKVPIMGVEFTDQAAKIAGKAFDTFQFGGDYYDVGGPNPFNKQFVAAHRAAYKVDPEFYGANYYEHVFIFWELVKRALAAGKDATNTDDLQELLIKNPNFASVYGGSASKIGVMSFNLKDHSISKPMGIFTVKNGKPVHIGEIRKWTSGPYDKALVSFKA